MPVDEAELGDTEVTINEVPEMASKGGKKGIDLVLHISPYY